MTKKYATYPDDAAVLTWTIEPGRTGHIVPVSFYQERGEINHYCGYVVIDDPVPDFDGRMNDWVDAYCGITYEDRRDGKLILGFDCAHAGDEADPNTRNMDWLRDQIERMNASYSRAAPFIERYIEAQKAPAAIQDEYRESRAND